MALVLAACAQLALLAVLWLVFGLGLTAWLTGLGFTFVLTVLLWLTTKQRRPRLGPADQVTLIRTVFIFVITVLVAEHCSALVANTDLVSEHRSSLDVNTALLVEHRSQTRTLFTIWFGCSALALALDAVDGLVARRTGTSSAFGARFDMEADAFLILVLSVYTATNLGGWVLAIGVLRYAFLAASWPLTWLRAPLPPSFARKTVAALQGVLLLLAVPLPKPPATVIVALALALLCGSFGRDILWLRRNARPQR